MSIKHNRIKVSDLEANEPNKILITNEIGELEFSDFSNAATEFRKENFEFTGSKIFVLSQPAVNVLSVLVDGITLNGTAGAPLQYRMNSSTQLEILDEMILEEDIWVSITYNYTGSINSSNGVQSVTGEGVDNTDPQNPVIRINSGATVEDQIVDGVTDKSASQNAVFDALLLKADDNNVLHKTMNESFTGTKSANNSGSNVFNGLIFNQVYGSGTPLRSTNSDSGSGIELINNGSGQAAFIANYTLGTGLNIFNNGSGNGLYVNNNGSGNGVQINITGTTNANKKSLLITDNTSGNNGYLVSLEYGSEAAASLPFRITKAGTTTYSITNAGIVTASSFKIPAGLSNQSLQADGSVYDLSLKADKVTGKSLLSDAEITRLSTLSNYTHPANHDPSIITQDPTNRFVTDIEKATWNAKQANITAGTNAQYFRGDKTWQTLDKTAAGLANVDNTADAAKNVLSATKLTTARTINGVSFDGSANVTISAVDTTPRIASSEKGAANGVATLDASGIIPANQLPSYVDDVLEYTNLAGFPATGETGKIYVAKDTNKTYRWSGTAYVYITSGAVDSVAGKTGVVTLAKADVGLASVDNTADTAKNVLSATKLTTARTINGVAFDGTANVTINAVDATARIASSEKGTANGVATLDASGVIPAAQLPSYVDDVLEYTNLAGFPATGETGKIYVAKDTNKIYRWSGTAYVYITSGAVDSVAGKTGVVTLVKADVGLTNVDNTADGAKNVLSATKLTTARTINGVAFDGTANVTITDATKENGITAGANTQYFRGDKSWQTLDKTAAGLANVDNTADAAKNVLSATKLTTARTINGVPFDGTANITVVDATKQATGAAFFVGTTSIANNRASASQALTGVSIDGNSATATTLQTSRTINGVAFNGSANITINAVDATPRIASSEKGVANGVATLDASGIILTSQLPSYVDDVLEYTNLAGFPATGETGKIYVAKDTNKTYRWSGTAYVYITSGAVDSVAGKTGVVTLAKADVGLASVDNTADAAKNVLSATKLTTARTINGVAFDGSANVTITDSTKENSITAGSATQYFRGDKTWQPLDKTAVGLANVDNTADAAKNVLSATKLTTARTINGVAFDGTANITVADTTKLPIAGGTMQGDIIFPGTDRSEGVFGTYDSTKTQSIWSMGTAYRNSVDGSTFGTLYGFGYKHTNNTTGGTMAGGHQAVWCQAGVPKASFGDGIWTIGTVTGASFIGSGSGLTGTAGSLSIGGNAATATTAVAANAATRISFVDGPRTLSDRLPNSFARTVNFDFVNAATVGGSGNYGGVMTFAPWDGLSTSTGDSSYQLAFRNESGINGSGLPGLRLRKGIDTAWGGWYDMIHSGNYSSYSAFSGAITGTSLTVTGDVTAFSDARVKENIRPISNVLERIQASRGVVYDRIDTLQKDNIGFIAQELEENFPELVLTREDGTKAVKYQNAVAVLFEAIKDQQSQIEELKGLVAKLLKP